jgi:hypothetical protein
MQLSPSKPSTLKRSLGLMTAALFAATGLNCEARAQDSAGINSDTSTDLGLTRVDSGLLIYQEDGGRVQAIEPVVSVTLNHESGDILTARFTSDTLTGATPNGAAPWKAPQTFTTPAHAPGTQSTVTGASGGSSIVTIPGVGTVVRQYTTPAGALPVDAGFRDQRFAFDLGYSTLFTPDTRGSLGGSFSTEHDYRSFSINTGLSQDLFQKSTTVSVALNSEFDESIPYFGTPTPFTPMSGVQKGGNQGKTVLDLVVGGTQVMNRYWLAQINYSYGSADGYQTDPYRIISVIDPLSGAPSSYLYENRPRTRVRQSLYFGNKLALGPTVADVSFRAYRDSWGIRSTTVEASERIPIVQGIYIEPHARYYSQTAASFYRPYLLTGDPLPAYASSDNRLGSFDGMTFGLKVGFKVGENGELYLRGERYRETGPSHVAGEPAGLAGYNLFSGVSANSLILGYTFAFE